MEKKHTTVSEDLEKTEVLLKEINSQKLVVAQLKATYELHKDENSYWEYRRATRHLHILIEDLWKVSCKYELDFAYTRLQSGFQSWNMLYYMQIGDMNYV